MPSVLLPFSDAEIHMRYREPFLTEGLNAKLAINQPRGVYRGFRLSTSGFALTVTVTADPDGLDHSAVYQTATGLSLTLRKTGGNFSQDLSAYANKTVVLAIHAAYLLGTDTSAELRGYELSPTDEFTGAAERPELVVIGTVVVPAAGLIPAANITHARRTMAWENTALEAVTWAPILRNGSFETSETGATHVRASRFWSAAVTGTGTLSPVTTDANTGLKSLQFAYVSGTPTAVVTQPVNVPVTPGQLIRAQVFVKAVQILTAGTISLALTWRDGTGAAVATSLVPIPATGVDASYRKIESTIPVPASPAGILTLAEVQIQLSGVSFGVAAAAIRFDDLQVYVESQSVTGQFLLHEKGRTYEVLQDLLFEEQAAWTQDAIALRFANSTGLVGERKDQSASSAVQPVLDWRGRAQLGANLLDTEAKALQARVTAGVSVVGGVDFTLMWQSVPSGQVGYRKYVSSAGELVHTINAVWGGGSWAKDIGGVAALKETLTIVGQPQKIIYVRNAANNSAWNDGSWDQDPFNFNFNNAAPLLEIVAAMNLFGNLWLSNGSTLTLNNANLILVGTADVSHGTRTIRYMTNNPRASFLSGSFPSNSVSESFGTGSTAAGTWFFPLDPWPANWRLTAARFYLPSTIVGSGGLLTLQERKPTSYTSISSDYSFTNGENGLKSFTGITAATHADPLGIRMNLSVGSTTTALVSRVELDYDVP